MDISLTVFKLGYKAICIGQDEDKLIAEFSKLGDAISDEAIHELASIGSSELLHKNANVDRAIGLLRASYKSHIWGRQRRGLKGLFDYILRSRTPDSALAQSYIKGFTSALMVAELYGWRRDKKSATQWANVAQQEYEKYCYNIQPTFERVYGRVPPREDQESILQIELTKSKMSDAINFVKNRYKLNLVS